MAIQTFSNLRTRSQEVKNETVDFANDELRIGGLLEDFVDTAELFNVVERENNTVLFDRPYIIGNTAPRTGNVLFDFTGAKLGCVVLMRHQDGSAFTIPSEGERQNDKPLSTTVVNNIMFWLVDDTVGSEVVFYTVTQEVV